MLNAKNSNEKKFKIFLCCLLKLDFRTFCERNLHVYKGLE